MLAIARAASGLGKFEASSPDVVRDLIFIDDVMDAFMLAIQNIQKSKAR